MTVLPYTYFGGPLCGELVTSLDQACTAVFYGAHGGTYTQERTTRRYVWRHGKRVGV